MISVIIWEFLQTIEQKIIYVISIQSMLYFPSDINEKGLKLVLIPPVIIKPKYWR